VAAADEVGRLQRGGDAECRFFQGFMEEGHYGGRTEPTGTRQGTYAVTPGGAFLASVNTRRAKDMTRMLERALAAWEAMEPAERLGDAPELDAAQRFERHYPEDGLVLRCVSRDLEVQEDLSPVDWRRSAWNQDFAWFREEEVQRMLPEPKVGATRTLPDELARRLTQLHLLDNVRGQTPAYRSEHVQHAELVLEVTAIEDGALRLALRGRTRVERPKGWQEAPEPQGLAFDLQGRALASEGRFEEFQLLAIGKRWGGTQYNARQGQTESKLAIALVLDRAAPRVAPANHWRYGW